MRRGLFAAVVLAFALPLAGAASPVVEADFAPPAQAEGRFHVAQAQWALLVFHNPEHAEFRLTSGERAVETNSTYLSPKVSFFDPPIIIPPQSTTLQGPVQGQLRFNGPWASLLIQADSISLSSTEAWASLARGAEGESMVWHQFPSLPEETTNPKSHEAFFIAQDGVATRLQAPNKAAFPLRLHATGIQHMEWYNADVTCSTPSCPDSSHPGTTTTPTGMVRVDRFSYIHLEPTNGILSGNADVLLAAVGGPIVDASVDGRLRLQDAHLEGSCPGGPCPNPEGRTFLVEGNMSLSSLSPRDGRLQGELTGQFTSAAFDESPQDAFTVSTGTAVAAGIALVGLAWIVKHLVGLFIRSDRPSALVHRKRRRLYELVKDEPGLSFRDLHRRLGWPDGTLSYHLKRLVDDGLVAAEAYRNTVRHFENHGRYTQTWKQVTLLQDFEHRRLHDWLLRHPDQSQIQIITETATWGWTRSTTLRRLANLTEAGLLDKRSEGRRALYQATPAPDPLLRKEADAPAPTPRPSPRHADGT